MLPTFLANTGFPFYLAFMKNEAVFVAVLLDAVGDFFTESSVLLFIFGILEKVVSQEPITPDYGLSIIGITLILLMLGCILRTWRLLWNFQSGS